VSRPFVLGAIWARLDSRLRKLFMVRKRALYEQADFDRRSAFPKHLAGNRAGAHRRAAHL
jgi:hypothetical protein